MVNAFIPLTSSNTVPEHGILHASSSAEKRLEDQGEFRHVEGDDTWRALVGTLKRRKLLIISCVGLITVMVTIIAFLLPQRYAAESMVILDTRRPEIVQQTAVLSNLVSGSIADPAIVRTEVALIRSPAYARKVIERLNLLQNPVFLSEGNSGNWANEVHRLRGFIGTVMSSVWKDYKSPSQTAAAPLSVRLRN